MAILGFDLGGTKLAMAVFDQQGKILFKEKLALQSLKGAAVGALIAHHIQHIKEVAAHPIEAIGVAVPGIYNTAQGTVWAPNIDGWSDYPLLDELRIAAEATPVIIDSDRTSCILGELWKGVAKGCTDAIFLTVGTGIGAGILTGGNVLRGANHIGGAIGWMAIDRDYESAYQDFGCLETYGSGDGMARLAHKFIQEDNSYQGLLKGTANLTAGDIFRADEAGDPLARKVLNRCITSWGMATANLISLFNPEKIIFGGGVFGPALVFLDAIKAEADKWAQPISRTRVHLTASALGSDACLYGAGFLAKQFLASLNPKRDVS